MNFDFLKNTVLKNEQKEVRITGRTKQELNPTNGASLRLFKDGSIYPSQELVDKYNLEYTKDKSGNGFDVFSSKDWNMYPSENTQHVVFINAIPKSENRVDLFGSAREVNGEFTSVMEQGSKTFGEILINMIQDTYGIILFENSKYVDLMIVEDISIPASDGIYFIPKMVNKGENKGSMTTVRRENIIVNPLTLFKVEDKVETTVEVEETADVV